MRFKWRRLVSSWIFLFEFREVVTVIDEISGVFDVRVVFEL